MSRCSFSCKKQGGQPDLARGIQFTTPFYNLEQNYVYFVDKDKDVCGNTMKIRANVTGNFRGKKERN